MRVLIYHEAGPTLAARLPQVKSEGLDIDILPVSDRERLAECLPKAEIFCHVQVTGSALPQP